MRVLQHGTHGVDANRYNLILDGGINHIASDIKTAMRMQASRGRPHFGLTVDLRGAHRIIVIRPEDWPLLACQLTPEGDVYIKRVGTFGISSAS